MPPVVFVWLFSHDPELCMFPHTGLRKYKQMLMNDGVCRVVMFVRIDSRHKGMFLLSVRAVSVQLLNVAVFNLLLTS